MVRKYNQTCTRSRRVVLRLLKCLWIHMQKQKPTLYKDRNMRALNWVLKRLNGYLSSNNESLWMMTVVVIIRLSVMCNYCYATGNDPNYDYWLVWMKWMPNGHLSLAWVQGELLKLQLFPTMMMMDLVLQHRLISLLEHCEFEQACATPPIVPDGWNDTQISCWTV